MKSQSSGIDFFNDRMLQYAYLMRFHRPVGIYLLLWPAMWALWIAGNGAPDPLVAAVIICGVVIMRAAGCVINDYADRRYDPLVSRTRDRPIAAGRVSAREALVLFIVLISIAFCLVLMLNTMTILLSFVGAFLATSYPFLKRYTHLPQVYLGLAFGWAIPMVFAAQTESVPTVAWFLYIATIFWALAYDTMYAMVDREEDLSIGVKSTAILFGDLDRVWIASIQVLVLLVLVLVGFYENYGIFYFLGLLAAATFSVYQQILIYHRAREGCFKAFLNNQWFGAAVFVGLLLEYWS